MRERLEWLTLQERRAKARVYMMHKIYYNIVAIPLQPHFHLTAQSMTTRGAHVRFIPPVYLFYRTP